MRDNGVLELDTNGGGIRIALIPDYAPVSPTIEAELAKLLAEGQEADDFRKIAADSPTAIFKTIYDNPNLYPDGVVPSFGDDDEGDN